MILKNSIIGEHEIKDSTYHMTLKILKSFFWCEKVKKREVFVDPHFMFVNSKSSGETVMGESSTFPKS